MGSENRAGFETSVRPRGRRLGFTLKEMVIMVSVLGVIVAIGVPILTAFLGTTKETIARRNAQSFSSVSSELAVIGVAHVIPESLGGVEATARLLRHGVIVPEGDFQGEKFIVAGPSDDDIESAAFFLSVIAQFQELSLKYLHGS